MIKKAFFKIIACTVYILIFMIPYTVFAAESDNKLIVDVNEIIEVNENGEYDIESDYNNQSLGEDINEDNVYAEDKYDSVSVRLNKIDHVKYLDGKSDGLFYPNEAITRAEAAKIIYMLMDDPGADDILKENIEFSDVNESSEYFQYIKSMVEYGIMNGYSDGTFKPDAKLTRAQFVKILVPFIEKDDKSSEIKVYFSDVPEEYWAFNEISVASLSNVISGYSDGTFRPNNYVTRAQTAVIINSMLGRTADGTIIYDYDNIRMYPDMGTDFWAYADIMEASVPHEYRYEGKEVWTYAVKERTVIKPGYNVINGILYYVDADTGDFARSCIVENHFFAYDGKYTTGNENLDTMIRNITKSTVNANMTQHQMLRALFNYEVKNYKYLAREKLSVGQTGWEESYAVPFFNKGKGNCYSFAAGFYYLAKNIGYNPKVVSGLVGHNRRPHGWVEININGITYIYDTELTMAKRRDGYSNIDLFEMTYRNAAFVYSKS